MAIKNGSKVKDTITGYAGTAEARCVYLNGCIQILIRPNVGKDGKWPEGTWIDEDRLRVTSTAQQAAARRRKGGPQDHPRGIETPRRNA